MGIPTAYITFVLGLLVGAIVASMLNNFRKTFGTLKIDKTDPEKDVYLIEIANLDAIENKKTLLLNVDVTNPASQN